MQVSNIAATTCFCVLVAACAHPNAGIPTDTKSNSKGWTWSDILQPKDGHGNIVAWISETKLTLIESTSGAGTPISHYVVETEFYNGSGSAGYTMALLFDFYDSSGRKLKDNAIVLGMPSLRCWYDRPRLVSDEGELEDNYVDIVIRVDREVSGPSGSSQHGC